MHPAPPLVCLGVLAAACATPPSPQIVGARDARIAAPEPAPASAPAPQEAPRGGGPRTALPTRWRAGDVTLQGFLGASFFELSTEGGSKLALDDEDATFPTVGGGAQWKLAGSGIDFGLEGLLQFAWNGNVAAFVSTGGGAAVAVDVDLLVFDLYAGPFVSCVLGKDARVYAGAGPLLRWGIYDQNGPTTATSGDGDGFGVGWYARTGVDFSVARNMMLGVVVRWSDTTMDVGGGFGDLDVHGFDTAITVTQTF